MDEQIKEALRNISDSYEDFVNCYSKDLKGNEEKQRKLLDYLKNNPNAQTDDVMEYVDDVLMAN
ncbi:MAG: hypothetical protein LUH14_10325 [Clostridiaceae bacterium]|nr:hypothetical protein [Clostridiaceae bacterium]